MDSFQDQGEWDDCTKVYDGNLATFWHTQWTPLEMLPYNIALDLRVLVNIIKMPYLPRQDGKQNGNIGEWQILLSNDTSMIGY